MCPSGHALLLTGIVLITVEVVFERGIKTQRTFAIILQNRVSVLDLHKLFMLKQFSIVFLLYQLSDLVILKVDSEVHVPKEAFVIVIAFLLCIGLAKILESIVVYLAYIF